MDPVSATFNLDPLPSPNSNYFLGLCSFNFHLFSIALIFLQCSYLFISQTLSALSCHRIVPIWSGDHLSSLAALFVVVYTAFLKLLLKEQLFFIFY